MSIRKRRVFGLATTAALVVGALGATIAIAATAVSGAGSTLAAPVYMQWGNDIKSKVSLQYNPSGSGAGVAALQAGTVGFAASDPPLGPADKAGLKKGPVVQIPTVLGAITVSYNLKGVHSGLKLDGPTIANIYLGHVTKWNDKAIQKLNPHTKLPNTAITVVHRSDSSGTTKGFTTFLAAYSNEWKTKVGVDKTVNWPTGTGAEKNSGVAAAVKQKGGSIGYVEQSYALQNHFTYASVKNAKGMFIVPNAAVDHGRGDRHQAAGRPRLRRDQQPGQGRVPDRVPDVHRRLPGLVQCGHDGPGGRRPRSASSSSTGSARPVRSRRRGSATPGSRRRSSLRPTRPRRP